MTHNLIDDNHQLLVNIALGDWKNASRRGLIEGLVSVPHDSATSCEVEAVISSCLMVYGGFLATSLVVDRLRSKKMQ